MGSKAANLTNQLLVAMPGLDDPHFSQTVTLVCEHSDKGALGIVLNKPLTMRLSEVLTQMNLPARDEAVGEQTVLRGGPVHQDRGFVLHRPGGSWESTHKISESIQVTTSRDVLAAMARGEGPEKAFIALGYAQWGAGQLEQELKDNSWLTLPLDESVLFELPYEQRWMAAWRSLGVDVASVSPRAGHA
ncbi:MAG TPA: YqgE/AlgH family protein [Steroidobacteraceae bacterium]|nr:YqgE/AlgH family protein [Steroidobacteraceae bacterium]HYP80996.1 YqgE/AlgH family protein [Steroidobacteraceae bacterium]